jgi:diguanylate cyclase (GGDEF)-like protein
VSSQAPAAVLLYMVDEGELVVFSARLATYGFQVVPVGSLDEGRRALGEHAIDCALVEVRAGEPAGIAIIGNVRSSCPQAPAVVLSSDLDLPSRIAGRDAGANHYLSTPIRNIDLDMCVAQLRLRMSSAGSELGASLEALPLPEPAAPDAGLLPLPEPGAQLTLENRELREKLLELGAQLCDAERREQEARDEADDLSRRLREREQEPQRPLSGPVEHTSGPSRPAPSIGGRPPPDVDPLTGLIGAGRLQDHLDREYARARRYGHALCVLMLDVDRLARYQKSHGKTAGDRALCLVADVLRAALRTPDIAARVGDDEFVIIATDTTEEQALQLAERLRRALREEGRHAVQPPVTVSIGIASCGRPEVKRAEDLLRSARAAVKQAKAAGRDRAAVAGP